MKPGRIEHAPENGLRELDAQVAERLMGFVRHKSGVLLRNDNMLHLWYDDAMAEEAERGELWLRVPQYSGDIALAMEVVEKMGQLLWQIEMTNCHKLNTPVSDNIRIWWVRFISDENDMNNWSAEADSLPEAICRAALTAVESKGE